MTSKSSQKRRLYQMENDSDIKKLPEKEQERIEKAKEMIRKSALASAPNGFVPIPVLNYGSLAFIQARLIKRMGKLYGMDASLNDLKKIITILLSCYISEFLASNTYIKGLRMLPGLAAVLGVGLSSTFYYYSTKIVGDIFLQHFESGGTILTFDPEQVKVYYARSLQQSMQT